MRPPFDFSRLIELCSDMVPQNDIDIIRLCQDDGYLDRSTSSQALAQWQAFEKGLRNELVMIRAARKKSDPQKYLRPGPDADPRLYHIAMASHRMPSFMESERFLDSQRWFMLDRIALGHYFDSSALIVYALKLRILLRWDVIERAPAQELLERTIL